jgi:hypothetical protein
MSSPRRRPPPPRRSVGNSAPEPAAVAVAEALPQVRAYQRMPEMQHMVLDVFQRAGGRAAMVEWARQNPGDFFTKVLPRLIPATLAGGLTGNITVVVEGNNGVPAQAVPGVLNSIVAGAVGSVDPT